MSLILDALNKAQRERQEQRQPVPQLSTLHYIPPPAEQAPPRKSRALALAGVVFAAALAFAAGLWTTSNDGAPPAVQLGAEQAPPSKAETPAIARNRPSERGGDVRPVKAASAAAGPAAKSEATPASNSANVADLYAATRGTINATSGAQTRKPSERSQSAGNVSVAADTAVKAETTATERISRPTRGDSQRRAEPVSQESSPSMAQLAAATREAATVGGASSMADDLLAARDDVPYVQELSWTLQQNLPSLIYGKHYYDSNPSARRVEINGSDYRAGAQIVKDLVLEEILSDGVILRYQSKKFKLQALNSWMNF